MNDLKLITDLGIKSILVIRTNGIPIYKYHFTEDSMLKTDFVLLSSFFSAINSFSNSFLRILSDIYFDVGSSKKNQEILFFKYYNNLIYVISMSLEQQYINISNILLRQKIEMILWQFANEFYDIYIKLQQSNVLLDLNNSFNEYEEFILGLIYKGCIELGENLPYLIQSSSEKKVKAGSMKEFKNKNMKQIIKKFGLESIFIIKSDGDLLIDKCFQKQENRITGSAISNYFLAIESFSRNYLFQKINSIGFYYNRLYIDNFNLNGEDIIILYSYNDLTYYYNSIKETSSVISSIREYFQEILVLYFSNKKQNRKFSKRNIMRILDLRKKTSPLLSR